MREAHARDALRRAAGDVSAAEEHATRARFDDAGDGAQRRRLARSVGSDAGHDLGGTHHEVDVSDHLECAVARGEALNSQQRSAGRQRWRAVLSVRRRDDGLHGTIGCCRQLRIGLAQICSDHLSIAANLGRPALGEDLAEVEHVHVVANTHDQAHVVIDEEHRHVEPLADRVEKVGKPFGLAGVEARGGLVEQDQLGSHRERAGNLGPALNAGG